MTRYPNFRLEALLNALPESAEPHCLAQQQGAVVFSRHAGRVLGLYPDKRGPNSLWLPPELSDSVQQGAWMLGGERLWLAPERDFYYQTPERFEDYAPQPALDPGSYQRTESLQFENRVTLQDYQHKRTLQAKLTRRFALLDDPFKAQSSGLSYVGISIDERIALAGRREPFAAWSITQAYVKSPQACGTGLFPLKSAHPARLVPFFDALDPAVADIQDGYARCQFDSMAFYKLAIRPEDQDPSNPTKAVFVGPQADSEHWFCLIKRSTDLPTSQAQCVDIAKNPHETQTGAVQAYNHITTVADGVPLHAFGEIELQLQPATPNAEGVLESRGTHQLLSYSGEKSRVLAQVQQAMGLSHEPVLYG